MRPSQSLCAAQLIFRCGISSRLYLMLASCLYFDNIRFDIFDVTVLSATLSRLYHVLREFHVSIDTLVQNLYQFSDFNPCSIALNLPM